MNREEERDKLVELVCEALAEDCGGDCVEPHNSYCAKCYRVAHNLLDNGIVVPPVKVGDYIWFFKNDKLAFGQIEDITISRNGLLAFVYEVDDEDEVIGEWTVPLCDIGKTVFLTREEAEKALEGKGE